MITFYTSGAPRAYRHPTGRQLEITVNKIHIPWDKREIAVTAINACLEDDGANYGSAMRTALDRPNDFILADLGLPPLDTPDSRRQLVPGYRHMVEAAIQATQHDGVITIGESDGIGSHDVTNVARSLALGVTLGWLERPDDTRIPSALIAMQITPPPELHAEA